MIKAFDTSGFNVLFKREYKLIKTGYEDIDSFLITSQQKLLANSNNSNNKVQGVIEIFGPSGSGKTDIALNILIQSIIPKQEPFNGNEIGVIYFDNDYKFDIIKLESLLKEKYLQCKKQYLENNKNNSINSSTTTTATEFIEFDKFLKSCLSRFYIYRCRDSFQFLITLKSLNQFIKNINSNSNSFINSNSNSDGYSNQYPTDINLIIIDSISAFYWIDRKGEGYSYPNLMWVGVIKRIINEFSILVIATKQAIFPQPQPQKQQQQQQQQNDYQSEFKGTMDILGKDWGALVKFRKTLKLIK